MYNCGVRLAVVLCVAACGGGAAPVTVDGKAIDSHPIERCSPTGAFGTPVELMTLNGPTADLGGRLSDDELAILFSRTNTDGTWDIWSSSRTDPAAQFAAPAVVGAINTIYSELWPTTSPDQKTLFIMTDRVSPGTYGIEMSTRASATVAWGPPIADADLMTGDSNPYVPNAQSLYFTSATRPGVASYDIFRGTLDSAGKVTAIASVIGGVNTAVQEVVPVVTADELQIYFGALQRHRLRRLRSESHLDHRRVRRRDRDAWPLDHRIRRAAELGLTRRLPPLLLERGRCDPIRPVHDGARELMQSRAPRSH